MIVFAQGPSSRRNRLAATDSSTPPHSQSNSVLSGSLDRPLGIKSSKLVESNQPVSILETKESVLTATKEPSRLSLVNTEGQQPATVESAIEIIDWATVSLPSHWEMCIDPTSKKVFYKQILLQLSLMDLMFAGILQRSCQSNHAMAPSI